jgi:hypothetical protein
MQYKNFVALRIEQGATFSIRQAFSDGFTYLGKNMGPYVGFTVVGGLISMVVSFIAGLIPFMIGSLAMQAAFSPALVMGYALYNRKWELNQNPEFGNFFDGFKTNYQQLLIANLVLVVITIGLTALLITPYLGEIKSMISDAAMDPDLLGEIMLDVLGTAKEYWWTFVIYGVVMLAIQILYLQVNYFVVFYNWGFWESLEASRLLMTRVFFKTLLYFIVIGVFLVVGGLVTFFVGLLFLYPAVMLMSYSIFEQLAGFEGTESLLEDDLIVED